MAERSDKQRLDDPAAAASYVATLSAELAAIAHQHGFDALGYILDMARLEAENTHRHLTGRQWAGPQFTAAD